MQAEPTSSIQVLIVLVPQLSAHSGQ